MEKKFDEVKAHLKNKKKTLKDFGLSQAVINEAFKGIKITSVRQIDVIGDNLLAKFFAALDVEEVAAKVFR